jgi:hypothetical protein
VRSRRKWATRRGREKGEGAHGGGSSEDGASPVPTSGQKARGSEREGGRSKSWPGSCVGSEAVVELLEASMLAHEGRRKGSGGLGTLLVGEGKGESDSPCARVREGGLATGSGAQAAAASDGR